ncbi:hypothetical protein RUMHYD_03783 [Blautia hydrogenotrophica DSM 10507]|uniref:Uncharacterized protein n=1 Tax=Blautia hydrogenotrophica (strain DSM 10507 / JCM 14656 / S5a33) TaxID=476272 RepID=C0CSB6_BLAHS|nr:hypothetical protein RUMHYD_03783 [Blautia hydrogenotrophica DSM 10507]
MYKYEKNFLAKDNTYPYIYYNKYVYFAILKWGYHGGNLKISMWIWG